jgi:hypothetical protein
MKNDMWVIIIQIYNQGSKKLKNGKKWDYYVTHAESYEDCIKLRDQSILDIEQAHGVSLSVSSNMLLTHCKDAYFVATLEIKQLSPLS